MAAKSFFIAVPPCRESGQTVIQTEDSIPPQIFSMLGE
jgi:hypothetical protein